MKHIVLLLTVLTLIPIGLPKIQAADKPASIVPPGPGESPAQRDARMAWWREARFGMFVHWGLYSGLAGTWDGKPVGTKGGMEWIQQRVKADTDTYAQARHPAVQAHARLRPRVGAARQGGRLPLPRLHHQAPRRLRAARLARSSDYDAGSMLHRDLVQGNRRRAAAPRACAWASITR